MAALVQQGLLNTLTGFARSLLPGKRKSGIGSQTLHNPLPSWPWNWWQYPITGKDHDYEKFGPVQTCINIISQDVSRIPLRHVKQNEDMSRELVAGKAPMRVFRKPNSYQTRSDWLLFMLRSLLSDGNSYNVAKRNDRGEVETLWPLPPWSVYPYIVPETGDVVYQVAHSDAVDLAQPDVEEGWWVPAREMLHVRLHTPKHPLIGETPLVAALYPTITGTEINRKSAAFFSNMSRPGGVLRHPGKLEETAMKRIKERWQQISGSGNTGDVAVLQEGMEWQALEMTAVDSELAKIYQLSERQIFQLFRVPPFLGGDLEKATFTNVESLTRFYLQSCLGFYFDHLEAAFTAFFRLPPNEQIQFDVDQALLAGDLKERMDAYGKAVQNGVMSPNEARARESLPPAEFGDQPRVQQQLVPLAFGVQQTVEGAGVAPPAGQQSVESEAPPPEEEQQVRASILTEIMKVASP